MEELRSFLPREEDFSERPTVKIDPITSLRPTNRELGNGINQIHACFEAHKDTNSRSMKKLKAEVSEIRSALGLDGSRKKPAGLSSPSGAFMRTVGATTAAITGVVLVWKVLAFAAPGLAQLFTALNDAIVSGKL